MCVATLCQELRGYRQCIKFVLASATATETLYHNLDAEQLPNRVLAGTVNVATSSLEPPSPRSTRVSPALAAAPAVAQPLPSDLRGLADAAAPATPGTADSHLLLVSVTTAGGFCLVALCLAAAVFCVLRRQKKKDAFVVKRKPSQASMGSSGRGQGSAPKPSPQQTTPKGLRQAYAKAAGLYEGEAFTGSSSSQAHQ